MLPHSNPVVREKDMLSTVHLWHVAIDATAPGRDRACGLLVELVAF
jgi:hypothetical protein